MDDRVVLPGRRGAFGRLDTPPASSGAVVVACPPHPQHGSSSDPRIQAVSNALVTRAVACLRVDYGSWGDGAGERRDIGHALDWARTRYRSVGLCGYSFGAAVAILVSAVQQPDALGVLMPPSSFVDGGDVAGALMDISCPVLVCHGTNDTTVDSEPVVTAARESDRTVTAWPTDHLLTGYQSEIAGTIGDFFVRTLL